MAASPSPLPALLPDPSKLNLDEIVQRDGVTVIRVSAAEAFADCPLCGIQSVHVHSRYCRTLRDLPCYGSLVRIELRSRRFYCRIQVCRRRVFTQRLPTVAPPYGRQTGRHREALLAIGYALGGEGGYRLAAQLGFSGSADTILRATSQSAYAEPYGDVKVLGVDDWAWRRGHRYGTVLVDLERRQPIDLLPDRESGTLAKWLRAHPTVQVISRDRAGAYAEGARQGAPDAVQIADRFHLLCNLTQAVQRVVERFASSLPSMHLAVPEPAPSSDGRPAEFAASNSGSRTDEVTADVRARHDKHYERREQDRNKRKALFEAVKAAAERGLTNRAIAVEIGVSRTTVRKILRMVEFPERAPRQRQSELDVFRDYLEKRWAEGCHNASQLCRELRHRGYGGQRSRVKEYVQPWRIKSSPAPQSRRRTLPNVRLIAFWLTKSAIQRTPDEHRWAKAIATSHPQLALTEVLAQQFRQLFKGRDFNALNAWLVSSLQSGIPELNRFANGIQRDYEAVVAAVEQPWSNGQVEGQVHRLKLLKRQMYGRSGFPLLRRRVLPLKPHAPHSP